MSSLTAETAVLPAARVGRERALSLFMPGAVAAALAALFVQAVFFPRSEKPCLLTLEWGVLVFAAMAGWGTTLESVLVRSRLGWGFCAASGMAAMLWLGAVLLMIGLFSTSVAIALVFAGLALLCAHLFRSGRVFATEITEWAVRCVRAPGFPIGIAIVFGLLLVQSAGSMLQRGEWYIPDDLAAYSVFPKQMLQTSSFEQPFSFRRIVAHGGQSLLQAFVLVRAPEGHLAFADRGLCPIIVALLTLDFFRRHEGKAKYLAVLPLWFLVTLPNIRTNNTSIMSSVVPFLGAYAAMSSGVLEHLSVVKRSAIIALFVATACIFRHTNIVAAAVLFVVSYGSLVLSQRRRGTWEDLAPSVRETVIAGGFILLFWGPWLFMSYRSSGTPIYPLMQGYFRVGNLLALKTDFLQRVKTVWDAIFADVAIRTLPLFALAGCLVRDESPRKPMVALGVAAMAGILAMGVSYFIYAPGVTRYSFGYEVAAILAISVSALRPAARAADAPRGWSPDAFGAGIALAAMFLQFQTMVPDTAAMYSTLLAKIDDEYPKPRAPDPKEEIYAAIQQAIPPGESVWTMLDEPYRLDFRRNRVYIGDIPGFVSPPPGMPIKDAEKTAAYLLSMGIRYFAYVNPSVSYNLYNRVEWQKNLAHANSDVQLMAPYVIDMFNTIDALYATRRAVYDKDWIAVLDLKTMKTGRP